MYCMYQEKNPSYKSYLIFYTYKENKDVDYYISDSLNEKRPEINIFDKQLPQKRFIDIKTDIYIY